MGRFGLHDDPIDYAALESDNQPTYTAPGPPRNVPIDLTDFFKSLTMPRQTLTMNQPVVTPGGIIYTAGKPGSTAATDWTPLLLIGGGLLLFMTMGGKGRR